MSGALPTAPSTDRTVLLGSISMSCITQVILFASIFVAWWTGNSTALQLLFGVAATNATTAVNYWMGSSSGSKSKDGVIAQQAASAAPAPVALSSTTMGTSR